MRFDAVSLPAVIVIVILAVFVVVLILLRVIRGRRRAAMFFSELKKTAALRVYTVKSIVLGMLLVLGLSSLLLALFRPTLGLEKRERLIFGLDIMFCLDISNSMLAEDIEPSRLESAKIFMLNLVARYPQNSYGITLYKGDGVVALPLTQDTLTLRRFIAEIHPGLSTVPGTDIESGLSAALNGFSRERPGKEYVFLLSDGESFSGNPFGAGVAEHAGNVEVWTFLTGTESGGTIDTVVQNEIVTKAEPEILRKIAEAYNGFFFDLDEANAVEKIEDVFSDYAAVEQKIGYEYFYAGRHRFFLIIGIVIMFIYIFLRAVPWKNLY